MDNLDILMLGCLYPKEMEDEIYKKSIYGMEFASNAHQWLLVEGLDSCLKEPVGLLNILPIGSYPKRYKDLFIKEFTFSHKKGALDINAGFFNLTVLKKASMRLAVLKHIKRWAKTNNGKKKVLIVYTVQSEFLAAIKWLKNAKIPVHICLIVPDLPAFTDIDKKNSLIYSLRAKYRTKNTKNHLNYIDSFVFLTKYMNDYFNANKPYIVLEGISDEKLDNASSKISKNKIITYTGTFTKKYGIMDLVYSFMKIKDKSYRLYLCGDGQARDEIIECAKKDKRIVYMGALTREDTLKLQSKSTLLVNPRKDDEHFTKYSFPSKIMEYLTAAKPVLCHKLRGVPDEYDNYLLYFKSYDYSQMASDMVELCEKSPDELIKIGSRGREFVLKNKNAKLQAQKILEMIGE